MVKATGIDILKSYSILASYWVKDFELESVISFRASVFALKITRAQLVVQCIYATAVFGYERTYNPYDYRNNGRARPNINAGSR